MSLQAFLLVDAGNTAVKSCLVRSESSALQFEAEVCRLANDQADATQLMAQWSALASTLGCSPQEVGLAWVCVGPESIKNAIASAYALWAKRKASLPLTAQPEQLICCARRMLRNRYDDPAQLGADRWVSALGMASRIDEGCVGNHLIVSAGTATTVDLIRIACENDVIVAEFAGGWILPGLAMMQEGLRSGTAALGDQVGLASGSMQQAPRNSALAIGEGIALAQTGFLGLLAQEFGVSQLWLHGGAALQWKACLEITEPGRLLAKMLRWQPDLSLNGLASLVLQKA